MSVNKDFGEFMETGVKGLVEHSKFNKATNHVTYDASKLELPEGITVESLKDHVTVINNLSAQAEVATQRIAHEQYEHNKDLTTLDGTLDMGAFTINSQYHLKQQVGEEFLYGQSTTAVDYMHAPEQAQWLSDQRTASQDLAAKLFG